MKFKAVILADWMKDNVGQGDPRGSGGLIRTIHFPGKGKQECILFRKGTESECDVDLETSLFAAHQEELQGTQNQIRSSQAKAIHRQAAKHATEIASSSSQAQEYIDPRFKQLAAPEAEKSAEKEEDPLPASQTSNESDEGPMDFVSSIMAEYMPTPKSQLKTPKKIVPNSVAGHAVSKAVQPLKSLVTSASSDAAGKAATTTPQEPSAKWGSGALGNVGGGTRGKGAGSRGKGKRSQMIGTISVVEILDKEGFPALQAKAKAIDDKYGEEPFASWSPGDSDIDSPNKVTLNACKQMSLAYSKIVSEATALETKLSRRKPVCDEALQKVTDFKRDLKSHSLVLQEASKHTLVWEKCQASYMSLPEKCALRRFAYISYRMHQQRAKDLLAFGKLVPDLSSLLDYKATPIPYVKTSEALEKGTEKILEHSLVKILTSSVSLAGNNIIAETTVKLRDFAHALRAGEFLSADSHQDMGTLADALLSLDEDDVDIQSESRQLSVLAVLDIQDNALTLLEEHLTNHYII